LWDKALFILCFNSYL